jgi:hypothetical protein
VSRRRHGNVISKKTEVPMMRARRAIAALLLATGIAPAQTSRRREAPPPADAVSVDSIVAALYVSVSHAPDAPPDFERMRGIFLWVGMIVPPKRPGGDFAVSDVDGLADRYQKSTASRKEKGQVEGLSEREIARRTDCFGNVCQVFSTFESRHSPADASPFERGINSIQLLRDGNRWWIASLTWDTERPDNPIPPQYLPASKP